MNFKMDDAVKISFTTLAGTVKGVQVNPDTFELSYLVEYTDNAGEVQHRYFTSAEIESSAV